MIGTILIAAGALMLIGAAARALAERKVRWWSTRAHAHPWRPLRAVYDHEHEQTAVLEECRRCPALQQRLLPGAWMVNRLHELSPVERVTEAAAFERMMR